MVILGFLLCLAPGRGGDLILRVGYFPNVTHAQAVIGSETAREGHGWFEARMGPGVLVRWYPFNAGPGAIEAMFAGSIDLAYVGPSPALNGYFRSEGDEIRVLAGAAQGGAALVVARSSGISRPADFRGRRLATPQLGNTQDVAARAWLMKNGLRVTLTGGDVLVVPTDNADQLPLLEQGRIDAVWTVEPWVSRLESEAGARVFLEQRDAVTTLLVASVRLLREHPRLAEKFLAAHAELTAWMGRNGQEARNLVRAGLGAALRREIPEAQIARAWGRIRFTDQVRQAQLDSLVADAQRVGFLREAIPLDRMFSHKP